MLETLTGCWPKEVEGYKDETWEKINGGNPIGWSDVDDKITAGLNFLRHARMVGGRLWRTENPFESNVPTRDTMDEQAPERLDKEDNPLDRAWPTAFPDRDPTAEFTREHLPVHLELIGKHGITQDEVDMVGWAIAHNHPLRKGEEREEPSQEED